MISLPDTLNDAVTWVRLKRRLERRLRDLEQKIADQSGAMNSFVLIGPSRSGKSSIASQIEAQGLLSHFEVDPLAKYLDAFSSHDVTSTATDWILDTVLRKFPRGILVEGGWLSRSFMTHEAQQIKWTKFQRWTDILERHRAKGFVVVANATQREYLGTIRRGREAGKCWSLDTLQDAELPELAASCLQKNALMQQIAAEGAVDPILISMASRADHVRSISQGVEQIKACI